LAGEAFLIAPMALVWLAIQVGLVEEYFFRAVLQTRLEQALRSPAGGIALGAILFGLTHAPGMYLRTAATQEALGAHPSLLLVIGYSIVVLSPSGIFFGVLWSRTRSLALVVVLHAVTDLVPHLLPFARHFHLA
jgi:membrane protease YdiL (CAAX protease family)